MTSIQDAITFALPILRAEDEARFRTRVRVEWVDVAADESTGGDIETATVVHESAPCRFRASRVPQSPEMVVGRPHTRTSPMIRFPIDLMGLRAGQRVTVLSSDTPYMVGLQYRLLALDAGDQTTAQRWDAESWAQPTS